ncbi:hypothetical protein [uncultured Methylibium sp.]|uniref:hypothetical protein n=1 Tax=uncultured Methylibium sp. TaxID=381093 RepID=UPI0025FE7BEA|nr:hypothetical protein [uncultured Methylibium sp.]
MLSTALGLWNQLPALARLAVVCGGAYLFSLWGASGLSADSTFSVRARTQALVLEVPCDGKGLTWDLPEGHIVAQPVADRPATAPPKFVTVRMLGGARASITARDDGRWTMAFDRSDTLGCAPAPDFVTVVTEQAALPLSSEGYAYESVPAAGRGPVPPWLVKGRIQIGAELQFGAGLGTALAMPMLASGQLQARTPDPGTGQRRLVYEEAFDPGSMVDTHACLDESAGTLADCVTRSNSDVQGFVQLARGEGGDGEAAGAPTFDVLLIVKGAAIGVREQGAAQRTVGVTRWVQFYTTPWVQIFASVVATLATLVCVVPVFGARAGPGDRAE